MLCIELHFRLPFLAAEMLKYSLSKTIKEQTYVGVNGDLTFCSPGNQRTFEEMAC